MAEYVLASNALSPYTQALIYALQEVCNHCETSFFVIGAWARDLHLEYVSNIHPYRGTSDTDVAFSVAHWETYDKVRNMLIDEFGFREGENVERLRAPQGNLPVDLVPFGDIEGGDPEIAWPPHYSRKMSTLGLQEAKQTADTFRLDNDTLSFRVVSLPALAMLKLIAWSQQPYERKKDATDLGIILRHYYDINKERVFEEHLDLLEDDFDEQITSARLLGRDMLATLRLSTDLARAVQKILQRQTHDVYDSLLADQMTALAGFNEKARVRERVQQLKSIRKELRETR